VHWTFKRTVKRADLSAFLLRNCTWCVLFVAFEFLHISHIVVLAVLCHITVLRTPVSARIRALVLQFYERNKLKLKLNWPATSRPSYTTRSLVARVGVKTWLAAAKLGRSVLSEHIHWNTRIQNWSSVEFSVVEKFASLVTQQRFAVSDIDLQFFWGLEYDTIWYDMIRYYTVSQKNKTPNSCP